MKPKREKLQTTIYDAADLPHYNKTIERMLYELEIPLPFDRKRKKDKKAK